MRNWKWQILRSCAVIPKVSEFMRLKNYEVISNIVEYSCEVLKWQINEYWQAHFIVRNWKWQILRSCVVIPKVFVFLRCKNYEVISVIVLYSCEVLKWQINEYWQAHFHVRNLKWQILRSCVVIPKVLYTCDKKIMKWFQLSSCTVGRFSKWRINESFRVHYLVKNSIWQILRSCVVVPRVFVYLQ